MSEAALFLNSGPLFSGDQLESLEETPAWESLDEQARAAFDRVRELFEKYGTLLAAGPTADETRYHMVGPTLHALGYTHSVSEDVELGDGRTALVDYVCFSNSADFYEADASRGGMGFFRPSIVIAKTLPWGADLDAEEIPTDLEGEPIEGAPAVLPGLALDALLRTTGRDYGILTNGCDWRLYHRGTSAALNTYFQADMIACMKSGFEDFTRFFLLFGRDAFLRDDSGMCFLDGVLQ